MNPIIFVLCLVLAAANGQIKDITSYSISGERYEDYIKLNRKQQAIALAEFDDAMANYKKDNTRRAESLYTQRDMVAANIIHMEERLNPLELLGDKSNKCVVKYRSTLPTVFSTTTAINNCVLQAVNALPALLTDATNYRNAMQAYFTAYFEPETIKCGEKFTKSSANHTGCLTAVIGNTNANIVSYQKTFAIFMDTAVCTANANMKRATDCVGNIVGQTSSTIAEKNVLINNCMTGKDDCKPCPLTCTQSYDVKVDYKSETISNPFYGQDSHKDCLTLNFID